MPTIPQFNRETKLNGTAKPYMQVNTNGDMFGVNVSQSIGNIAGGVKELSRASLEIQNKIDGAKLLELSNNISQWEQDNLYDKDNGYYFKSGKDAVGKSTDVMKSYDAFIEDYKSKNRISPLAMQRMNNIIETKKLRIAQGVNNHDVQETNNWAKTEGSMAMDNAILGMIHGRNNPIEMKVQLASGVQAVRWQGQMQKLDSDTITAMEKDFISKAHESVINAYIEEGSLQAGIYFEKYKDQIKPQMQAKYIGAIKNEEMKYHARSIADDIISISANEEEAVKKAEEIKDINLSDRVVSRIKHYYSEQEHYKNQAERDALNGFYSKAVEAAQQGGTLSYDDIPENIDPKTKLSLMNYVNKNGQPETDNDVWEDLYKMSVNNAQGFVNEDLNKYRGYLSEGEYKQFVKRQEDIKSGAFYTQIKDDDKMIKAALQAAGLNNNSIMPWAGDKKDIAYSEIRSLVREFEARKGRKITDDELTNIVNSLGYKGANGVQNYKLIEQGMREKTGFMKDIINDFVYYQSKHNGEMPSNEEKSKIINNRLSNFNQQKNEDLINSLSYKIQNTVAKPNETKELTYYADTYLPQLGTNLGVKFTIVEGGRYRKPNGKYISHHSAGEAVDVSMSEHAKETRYKFIESQINNPQVKKIGTSDPNILAKYGNNPKIVDETNFDKKHGTNHRNHAHITLNTQGVKIKTPDGRIVHVPQNMVSEALKHGGVKI